MIRMNRIPLYLYVKLKKYLNKDSRTIIDPRELKARSVAITLINEFDSILKICPSSFKRFILNERLGISVIINSNSIDFFGDRLHTVNFCKKHYDKILDEFDKVATKDREKLELLIKANVQNSFDDIYDWVLKSKII